MTIYIKKPDGTRYHPAYGRIMQKQGYALRIHWSADMLDYLRRYFPTTLNEELAGCLGVSMRTMIRKARELGLEKDPKWLRDIWNERRQLAHIISRHKCYPGGFQKGVHSNPQGEFKPGRTPSEEEKEKRSESMKRWYRLNPKKAREKALKAWETRRNNNKI